MEHKVLDRAVDPEVGQGYGDFKRCVRRAVLAADPRRAEEKFTAAYEDRRVCDTPDGNGNAMGWFGAYLPDHQRQALWNRLTDAAQRSRRHRTPGDDRSMDQRRADALGHWGITGTLDTFATFAAFDTPDTTAPTETAPAETEPTETVPAETVSAEADTETKPTESQSEAAPIEQAASATPTGRSDRCRCGKRRAASTTGGIETRVVVALSTLAGIDDQPAELDGIGPIPAALARMIAFSEHGSTWRRLVTDPLGRLIDYGTTVYQPPAPLQRFVKARDQHCRAPGCFRSAVTCDLDHIHPFSQGGHTSACNLQPLCARHHKLKHEAGWDLEVHDDGTTIWVTPAGIRTQIAPATLPTDLTLADGADFADLIDLIDRIDLADPRDTAEREATRARLDRLLASGRLRPRRNAA